MKLMNADKVIEDINTMLVEVKKRPDVVDVKDENGKFDKFEERHYQRAYTEDEIIESLQISGFENIKVYGDFTFEKPKKDSERLFFICRK